MSATEERSSWTLPCHFQTLLLMNCRSRAEAFARSLHSKLKSLGRLTGDVQDDDEEDDGGTFMASTNSSGPPSSSHLQDRSSMPTPSPSTMAMRKPTGNERTYLMSAGRPVCHGSPDPASPPTCKSQQQHQHGEDELYFDFDMSSPESPDDSELHVGCHRYPGQLSTSEDFITRQPTSQLATTRISDTGTTAVTSLSNVSDSYQLAGNLGADEESGCISAVSSVMTEQDNDDDVEEDGLGADFPYDLVMMEDGFRDAEIYPWTYRPASPTHCSSSSSILVNNVTTSSSSEPLAIVTTQPPPSSPTIQLSPDLGFNHPPFSPMGKLCTIVEQITLEESEISCPNWQERVEKGVLPDDLGQGQRSAVEDDVPSNLPTFECGQRSDFGTCDEEIRSESSFMLNNNGGSDSAIKVNYINGIESLSIDDDGGHQIEDEYSLRVDSSDGMLLLSSSSSQLQQVKECSLEVPQVAIEDEEEVPQESGLEEVDEGRGDDGGRLGEEEVSEDKDDGDLDSNANHVPDKTKLTVNVHLSPPHHADSDHSSRDGDVSPTDEEGPRRVRRSSSLKTGKTPPGTPNRKKIVRFADAMGLDLEAVKTVFLDDLPVVPSSAFFDLEDGAYLDDSETNFTHGLTIYNSNRPDHTLIFPPYPPSSKPGRCSLVPVFPQPGSLADFMDRVRKQRVCLESAVVTGDSNIKLVVRVLNVDFHKYVTVRYTLNEWIDFQEVTADYVPLSNDGFSDKFSTVLDAQPLQVGERLWFAVKYVTQGRDFWDNNHGQNYCFQCYIDPQYHHPSPPDDSWIHFM